MRPWISAFLPAPLTIVVLSLSIITFLARPSILTVTFSSLMPRSAETIVPPVRIAMSSSIALRRSPKPGAFTAAALRPPRSLLTTRVASASPSMSSAMISNGLLACPTASNSGSNFGQLRFVDQDIRILHLDPHLFSVGDEIGRDVAAVELHALDHFELRLERLCFLGRDHALVADLLHRIGDETTNLCIAVGRDSADLGDLLVRGDILGVLLKISDNGLDRKIDAALEVHRVHAGGDSLGSFPDDRVSEHGRCSRTVAGLVGGLRGDLAHHLRAHVLELVFELDLLG